jgi:hypothetical protein
MHYIAYCCPDNSMALSFAATKNSNPMTQDFKDLQLVLVYYLWQTKEKGLILHPAQNKNAPPQLICHVDASYLAHPDAKSHTGYCLSFGRFGSVYSKSSKQKLLATSSTHADIIYVVHLCSKVGHPIILPAIIFEGNQLVIDLTTALSSKVTQSTTYSCSLNFFREQV